MGDSHTFLDYQGHVDLDVIDLLLDEFRKTEEFASLNEISRKRAYAILVECLENIYHHASGKSSNDKAIEPNISVREENERIIISAGNLVSNEAKEKLSRNLDLLSQSNENALRNMHKKILARTSKREKNGSGLGLVDIVIKSGNNTSYSFIPLESNNFYFKLAIIINKES